MLPLDTPTKRGLVSGTEPSRLTRTDLAVGLVELLGEVAFGERRVLPGGDEGMAVAVEDDPAAVVHPGRRGRRLRNPDILDVLECGEVFGEPAARAAFTDIVIPRPRLRVRSGRPSLVPRRSPGRA